MEGWNMDGNSLTLRSEEYREFIQHRRCVICNNLPPNQAHHHSENNQGWGTKPPDSFCVPLCYGCHRFIEDHGLDEVNRAAFNLSIVANLTLFLIKLKEEGRLK